jgi:toluene monooxygenase system ferredoxin subunit
VSFLDVLEESELWVGELRQVRLPCGRVLLLRTDAGVFAYEDRCPHLGLPLSAGTLEGDTLTCSAHQFQFDATTGQGKNPSCLRLRAYPVQLEAGVIRVDVAPLEREASELRASDLRPCRAEEEERRGR